MMAENNLIFASEARLEQYIINNFKEIFNDELELCLNPKSGNRSQYSTGVGIIDILALEKETNNYVVLELKNQVANDKTIPQILRYMGWIRLHLCRDDQTVRGIIICKKTTKKFKYAFDMIKDVVDIQLLRYNLNFCLSSLNNDIVGRALSNDLVGVDDTKEERGSDNGEFEEIYSCDDVEELKKTTQQLLLLLSQKS